MMEIGSRENSLDMVNIPTFTEIFILGLGKVE
jgi:hypothetical protein